MPSPFHFDFIPYPLWRRQMKPKWLRPLFNSASDLLTRSNGRLDWMSGKVTLSPAIMADYLTRWGLLPDGMDSVSAKEAIGHRLSTRGDLDYTPADAHSIADPPAAPLRLPAQWEPIETVIVAFPVLYPPLWETHAAMIKAISPVARVDVLIPQAEWAAPIRLVLEEKFGVKGWENVRLIVSPINDIWVRDYGPIVGLDSDGKQIAIDARFAPLAETYPQSDDDALPTRWAALRGIPVHTLPLFTEGGNLWSDGAGTLIMSDELADRHAELGLSMAEVEAQMHRYYAFDKLILTPRLWREETGHVDLVCKLASADTMLVGAPTPFKNEDRLRAAAALFQRETNAAGKRYQVIELPMPQVYLNWGVYPVWRSYTNALTVNGRVLVPVFDIPEDDHALRIYEQAMPTFKMVPIPCRNAANGGGAVHCLTKEIPAAQSR
ncbi:MAG: agmatine deiminase family protein [Anaerolineae bacterium]